MSKTHIYNELFRAFHPTLRSLPLEECGVQRSASTGLPDIQLPGEGPMNGAHSGKKK
jgi:hypothetical protein